MAEVVFPPGSPSHSGAVSPADVMPGRAPRIEMVPNPDFSFPMRHPPPSRSTRPNSAHGSVVRPSPAFSNSLQSNTAGAHRRAASTLPSFSFNAKDASGLQENQTPPQSPQLQEEVLPAPTTPSRRGHRRGGSEFVGGDSRLGVDNAMSTSPTKSTALPVPGSPSGAQGGRRGHAHRRSTAMSSHDVSKIMQPTEVQPRLSSSLPNTPLEHPAHSEASNSSEVSDSVDTASIPDPFGPPLDTVDERPPSSRRVGFSDNVTIIPRPLSTISSETESSISTVRGHSVNNSISSVLSLSTPSPPAARAVKPSLSTTMEDEDRPRTKSSLEISRRVEKEGEWLKSRSSSSLRRPWSESAVATLSTQSAPEPTPSTTSALPDTPSRSRGAAHKKKQSFSYGLSFDRRKSEPTIGMTSGENSRLSAISLEDTTNDSPDVRERRSSDRLSSTRKIKAWAASMIPRRQKASVKELPAASSTSSLRADSVGSDSVPGRVPFEERPVAETDLDAVLSSSGLANEFQFSSRMAPPARLNLQHPPTPSRGSGSQNSEEENDESAIMVDLDAALGPLQTPPIGAGPRQVKEMHSSRGTKDFNGFGHYHRRAESAPALAPFEHSMGVPQMPIAAMADVFEEEEEEDEEDVSAQALSNTAADQTTAEEDQEEGNGVGVEIVDEDESASESTFNQGTFEGSNGADGEWEPERHLSTYTTAGLRLSNLGSDRRASSLIEETIFEEASPAEEGIEIVEDHEEPRDSSVAPRASSLTKSSDSSEAPTLMGQPTDVLAPSVNAECITPTTPDVFLTPETYQTSTFSSPDLNRRQGSFETSRLGTSASSIADNRTVSSCCTTSDTAAHPHDHHRISTDDVPSLTSSRSTMLSTMHANSSRRDFASSIGSDRTPSASSTRIHHDNHTSSAVAPTTTTTTSADEDAAAATRRKRSSIQSLSQLVGGPFGSKLKIPDGDASTRPQTAVEAALRRGSSSSRLAFGGAGAPKKKEHRLKKLMFWKSKHEGSASMGSGANGHFVGDGDARQATPSSRGGDVS